MVSLKQMYPEITKEWNYEKNGKLTPELVSCSSNKKVWWRCGKGHEWQTRVFIRTIQKSGCPVCSGRIPEKGINDLATKCPEIAKEWNCEKNGDLTPEQVTHASSRMVWWKCDKGHEWQAVIQKRTHGGAGCPYCRRLQPRRLQPRLITEEWNYEKNGEPNSINSDSLKKVWWKCSKGHEWYESIYNRARNNTTCPVCNSERHVLIPGYNDLLTLYPAIAAEWNYKKNGNLTPDKILSKSRRRIWWKCSKCGHEWQWPVYYRTCKHLDCPSCKKDNSQVETL